MAYSKPTIAAIVALYFFVSISLVFLNKTLMSSKDVSVPAPLFITWFQCVVSVFICYVTGVMGSKSPEGSFWKQFPQLEYRVDIGRKTLALSFVFVGMITFNNLCLKFVEVSFYNVARSLTIVFNVILTFAILSKTTSFRTCSCLGVVVLGFFLGSEGEVNFTYIGSFFGILSSVFVSLNSIFTSKTLDVVNGDKFLLSAYTNTNAVFLFLPLMFIAGEFGIIAEYLDVIFTIKFWLAMTLSGVFGFSIGIVSMLQIQATSPLTHNISGTAKACVQTVLALLYYQNATTANNLLGIALVLFGSLLYTYVRMREMDAQKQAAPSTPSRVPQDDEDVEAALVKSTALRAGTRARSPVA